MKIYFFRHSYAEGQEAGDRLTADGRKRAEQVGAKYLTEVRFDRVIVSGYLRTHETVDHLAQGAGHVLLLEGQRPIVEPLLSSFSPELRVKLEGCFAGLPVTASVLVVGHGGILNSLVQDLTEEEKERAFLPCRGVLVEFRDGKYSVIEALR
jgi:broad specificity phosphatase PhoE